MANTNNNISSAAYATSLQQDIDAPSGYDVYSGADIKAVVHIPTDFLPIDKANEEKGTGQLNKTEYSSKPAVLGDIQTLSYSIYREKYPVRTIGMGYPKSFTRGPRTISGTMIFTMFNKQVLYDLMKRIAPDTSSDLSTPLIDQLPRFDITITFANEYGAASTLVIYGVEIISEGITMSIEDFFTENVVQYIAQDIRPMLPDTVTMDRLQSEGIGKTATDLVKAKKKAEPAYGLTIELENF